ncbi:MAG: hypothetical protein C0410_00980 [Anaerolinea sp.]|nr:hypothetical protein [Anaerolinea sp.]
MLRKKYFIALFTALLMAAIAVQTVFAISPDYLKSGRTYDQESSYIQWNGSVSYVSLYHRDNTSLPASEGGANCNNGCTETVTRIRSGSSVSGNFTFLQTFNVQVAYTGDSSVGTAIIRACGTVIATVNLYTPGSGAPGFNNFPSPAWSVPTSGDCTWSITASGGYVDFRAVTTSYRASPPPTVDIQINNTQGPLSQTAPGGYTLNWTSTNASTCTASGNWSGAKTGSGSQAYGNVTAGTYTYTLTCTNPSGSASDSVTAYVFSPPSVDVKANNLDGPLSFFEPSTYTVTWSSSNASSCQAEGNLTGSIGLNGSQTFNNILQGTYNYTVRCFNPVGAQVVDTVQIRVNPLPPTVDLRVEGGNGPITRVAPASYTLSWTSQYATSCSASSSDGGWTGSVVLSGNRAFASIPVGTHTYTVTCKNISGTASDSVTIYVVAPLSGTITVTYARLLLFAPNLGQPAQTLSGTVTGGEPPYSITVHVRTPSGVEISLSRSGPTWSATPQNSGDINFGTTEQGIWTAWSDLTDSAGRTYRTSSVTWEVAWHPVHGRP